MSNTRFKIFSEIEIEILNGSQSLAKQVMIIFVMNYLIDLQQRICIKLCMRRMLFASIISSCLFSFRWFAEKFAKQNWQNKKVDDNSNLCTLFNILTVSLQFLLTEAYLIDTKIFNIFKHTNIKIFIRRIIFLLVWNIHVPIANIRIFLKYFCHYKYTYF